MPTCQNLQQPKPIIHFRAKDESKRQNKKKQLLIIKKITQTKKNNRKILAISDAIQSCETSIKNKRKISNQSN